MKNSFLIVTATLLVSVFFSCTKERVTAGSVNEVYEFQSVDSTWKLLTLREKIGQTMLMLPDRNIKKHQSFLYCFNRIMNRE